MIKRPSTLAWQPHKKTGGGSGEGAAPPPRPSRTTPSRKGQREDKPGGKGRRLRRDAPGLKKKDTEDWKGDAPGFRSISFCQCLSRTWQPSRSQPCFCAWPFRVVGPKLPVPPSRAGAEGGQKKVLTCLERRQDH